MNMELRFHNAEFRATDDGTLTVSGYVNKTGQLSNVLGTTRKFVEKIAPGAFTRAIQNSQHDIDFLAEHDTKKILASTRNGSLQLREDEQGLFMIATIAPTSWGKDYYTLISSGIIQNMSFGFRTVSDSWKPLESGLYERTVNELELFEVSAVKNPAYSQSTIAARGIDVIEDVEIPKEIEEEFRNMEKLQEMLEKFEAFEQKIDALVDEVRSLKAKKAEVEDEGKNNEERDAEGSEAGEETKEDQVPETDQDGKKKEPGEEPSDDNPEEEAEETTEEEQDEEEKEDPRDENPDSDENKQSAESEDKETVEDEEKKRSAKPDPKEELAELRNLLSELK